MKGAGFFYAHYLIYLIYNDFQPKDFFSSCVPYHYELLHMVIQFKNVNAMELLRSVATFSGTSIAMLRIVDKQVNFQYPIGGHHEACQNY